MSTVIAAEGVSKVYRLGQLGGRTLSQDLNRWWAKLRGKGDPTLKIGQADHGNRMGEHIWALKDVSFTVGQGDILGIIGSNGAGKSTLLKILSRITVPTAGVVKLRGRVASLLEVGTGFHPELTGRENIYLNGAIHGMTRTEVGRKLDTIVEFADVSRFLDTPVKRYSSGMYVRLAFAVAAHLDPEILVVDEVLAVGDASFQKKCLGKMGDVAKTGRTVLFVSHNLIAVQNLCSRAMWLKAGAIEAQGECAEVVGAYLKKSVGAPAFGRWDQPDQAPGNDEVRFRRVEARPMDGSENIPTMRTPILLDFEYWNLRPGAKLNLSLRIYSDHGVLIFNTAPVCESQWHGRAFPAGLFRSRCVIPGDLLNEGSYRVEVLAVHDERRIVFSWSEALAFEVVDSGELRGSWKQRWPGLVHPHLEWTTENIEEEIRGYG